MCSSDLNDVAEPLGLGLEDMLKRGKINEFVNGLILLTVTDALETSEHQSREAEPGPIDDRTDREVGESPQFHEARITSYNHP